jgi:hypothetical protein
MAYAERFGIDLMAGQPQVLQEALATNHEAILAALGDLKAELEQFAVIAWRAP